MAGRILDTPGTSMPIGPIESGPSLKTVVDMLLANGFAMTVLWGRDLSRSTTTPTAI